MPAKKTENNPSGEIVLYQTEDRQTRIQVRLEGRTVWLTQRQIAELFQVAVPTVNEHVKNIYEEGELDPKATIRKFRIVQAEGAREVARMVDGYNLDAILAVGYRVRSLRGTQFRRWATERLGEYLVKGFTLDDERLKNPGRVRRIISTNCSNASGTSGRRRNASIRRFATSTRCRSTTTRRPRRRWSSSASFRTSFTGPSPARLRRN